MQGSSTSLNCCSMFAGVFAQTLTSATSNMSPDPVEQAYNSQVVYNIDRGI